MQIVRIIKGAALPDVGIEWLDDDGDVIPYASGHSFELKVGRPGWDAVLVKTTGITGADTVPNVTLAWAVGEYDDVDPGFYTGDLLATRDSDDKPRVFRFPIRVSPAVL